MPKKQSPKALRNKLWDLCKKIIRNRYGNTCYTCGRGGLEGSNWHTGHFIPSGACGAYLRYDLRNLRPQCYNCNINLGSNGAEYCRRMISELGQAEVDQIFKDKEVTIKANPAWFQQKIIDYQTIYEKEAQQL